LAAFDDEVPLVATFRDGIEDGVVGDRDMVGNGGDGGGGGRVTWADNSRCSFAWRGCFSIPGADTQGSRSSVPADTQSGSASSGDTGSGSATPKFKSAANVGEVCGNIRDLGVIGAVGVTDIETIWVL